MVENSRQLQSKDPFDRFHEAVNDPRLYESYHYPRADLPEPAPLPHDRVPLFLSDYEEERHQDEHYQQVPEYSFAAGRKKKRWVSRIVTGVLALSAIAAGFALFSIELDARRDLQRQGFASQRSTDSIQRSTAGSCSAAASRRTAGQYRTDRSARCCSHPPHPAPRIGFRLAVARRNHRGLSKRAQEQGCRSGAGSAGGAGGARTALSKAHRSG